MKITVAGVSVRLQQHQILTGVDLTVAAGKITGLIGPNGSGKSTLLRCLYRALKPSNGCIRLGELDLRRLPARHVGRLAAVVTQDHSLDNQYSVTEIVAMGRTPHKGPLSRDTATDRATIDAALVRVGMEWARGRVFATLSGGERQRVLVARALVQEAPVLLLDEPTNHLDIRAQLELLELVRELQLTTICALHDLAHAIAYCDDLVLLCTGRVVATGPPANVLTEQRVQEVFGVRSVMTSHPITGQPHLVFAPMSADQASPALPVAAPAGAGAGAGAAVND